MVAHERKQRERAEREQLIVTAAREMAEAEGWEAVTVRRLAERVEYSQPVLYSHFPGKDAIVAAVAVEGFAALTLVMRAARRGMGDARAGLAAVAEAYTQFAEDRPALYDAMFNQAVTLPFATPQAPAALLESFDELRRAVRPVARGDDEGVLTEVLWAALHGLATLTKGGRLPPDAVRGRLDLLIRRFLGE